VPGSDLVERLCAQPAGGRAGGVVYDRASGQSDPVAGDHGKIGTAFRTAVDRFATDNNIPVVHIDLYDLAGTQMRDEQQPRALSRLA
jgi:hypothetical protein